MFRPFKVPMPYKSTKDLFSLRGKRTADAYRKISLGGIEFKLPDVNPYDHIDLHLIPDEESGITEIRFWNNGKLVASQNIKNTDLNRVRF